MEELTDESHLCRPVISHSSSLSDTRSLCVSVDFVLISFFLLFFSLLTWFKITAAALEGGAELPLN